VVDQGKTYIAGYTDASDLVIEIPNPVIIFGDHTTEIKYVDFNFVAGADGTKILCPYKMDERFFYTCLLSYKLENRGYARHFKVLNENFMALPPLSEQHRIVAKVDELMALCDRLEERQNENDAAHQALVETLLATLTATANQGEFADAWQRIANYFATLFTTEHSIDQLKQTILQLAVMGKLVPQGPNDEPASVLLEKIAQEKARLVREGKIRKQEKLPDVGEDEKPFDLPIGWAWTRLGLFCEIKGGKRLPAGHTFSPVETPYLYIQVTNMKDGGITQDNLKYLSADTKSLISKYIISKDNLYITIAGTIGAVGMVPEYFDGMNLTENAAKIVFKDVDKAWLQKALSSEVLQRQFLDKTNQLAQPKLALHRVASSCIALPPLAEQHRIVAKVDELMALCDGLKARLKEAQTTQVQLADAVVEQAVA
jgi:type I restriction enzyme S subunit